MKVSTELWTDESITSFKNSVQAIGKRRIKLKELFEAFYTAFPEHTSSPTKRRLLHDIVLTLEKDNFIKLPSIGHWDTAGRPKLPKTVSLCNLKRIKTVQSSYSWVPKLSFAADERHSSRLRDLKSINTFLISHRNLFPIPTKERSLQIFGDEKRIDVLRNGKPAMFDGRLTLDDLYCYPVSPPLPYERYENVQNGKNMDRGSILVLENFHSYDSFRKWNRTAGSYTAVAYGGGNAFSQSANNLDELVNETGSTNIIYIGDLDPSGIEILIRVNESRKLIKQMPLIPHKGIYRWLLENGRRCPLPKQVGKNLSDKLIQLFPSDITNGLIKLWEHNYRIPQESFGLEQLYYEDITIAMPKYA